MMNGESFSRLATIRQSQIDEARATRVTRLTNIVETVIRTAADGNAAPTEQIVSAIIDNCETTSLTPDQRSWLTLDEEGEDDS